MTRTPEPHLRRGWTTGACATAAARAAIHALTEGSFPDPVGITLPYGERPWFALSHRATGPGWAEAGVVKDAGDDPDVTHGAEIRARVEWGPADSGISFRAGEGVGTVTRPGLPIPPGEPAINPVPRAMIAAELTAVAPGRAVIVTLSIPGGATIAARTWNPRLGIAGGLSVLGTTGIVRPFSCAAWIASIHRGIDVARASGLTHVAGCTGATTERAVQALCGLPDHAMLDMGDFVGGMLKYLRRCPVERVTIGGGIGKMSKLAQGAVDLHSSRSQVDFVALERLAGVSLAGAGTALEALERAGPGLAQAVAEKARGVAARMAGSAIRIDVVVVDRVGQVLARA